jgi:hypothetical protein
LSDIQKSIANFYNIEICLISIKKICYHFRKNFDLQDRIVFNEWLDKIFQELNIIRDIRCTQNKYYYDEEHSINPKESIYYCIINGVELYYNTMILKCLHCLRKNKSILPILSKIIVCTKCIHRYFVTITREIEKIIENS